MKVNGSGQPPTPAVVDSDLGNKAGKTDKLSGAPEEAGKSFAERVSGPRAPDSTTSAPSVGNPVSKTIGNTMGNTMGTTRRTGDVVVTDLAADLQAGKLNPGAAIGKILDRIVARQIGPEASPAVREQVRSALQDAVENDPLLAEKLRQLE